MGDSMSEKDRLYYAAVAADDAWGAELVKLFGKRAGDARYTIEGISTPELTRLYREKLEADEAQQKFYTNY